MCNSGLGEGSPAAFIRPSPHIRDQVDLEKNHIAIVYQFLLMLQSWGVNKIIGCQIIINIGSRILVTLLLLWQVGVYMFKHTYDCLFTFLICFITDSRCSAKKSLPYGRILSQDTKPGGQIKFECDKGYKLLGSSTMTCENRMWTGEEPTCSSKKDYYTNKQSMFRNYDHRKRVVLFSMGEEGGSKS